MLSHQEYSSSTVISSAVDTLDSMFETAQYFVSQYDFSMVDDQDSLGARP
jgi:hypothetical protein